MGTYNALRISHVARHPADEPAGGVVRAAAKISGPDAPRVRVPSLRTAARDTGDNVRCHFKSAKKARFVKPTHAPATGTTVQDASDDTGTPDTKQHRPEQSTPSGPMMSAWERGGCLALGLIITSLGCYAVLRTSNQAGSAIMLILGAAFLLTGAPRNSRCQARRFDGQRRT